MSSKKRKTLDVEGEEKDQWDDKAITAWIKDNKRLEHSVELLKDKISLLKHRAWVRKATTERVRHRYLQANTVEIDDYNPCPTCDKGFQHIKGEPCMRCGGRDYHWGHHRAHVAGSHTGRDPIVLGSVKDCLACKLTPDVSDSDDD